MEIDDGLELVIDQKLVAVSPEILERYNRPGPRYTSYPTAPEWDDGFGPEQALTAFRQADNAERPAPVSLYFHIPFCESLCLYCGCNVVINKSHEVAHPYLAALEREIERVSAEVSPTRKVEQLHWGGGTPTYLTPAQIESLYSKIDRSFSIAADAEISVEVDPRVTTIDHFSALRRVGFNRVSLGIQDFDPLVQKTVHRIQSYEDTQQLFNQCRDLGFESINVDLIYGLPHQTAESFSRTVELITRLNPDRIALFSYAHVPWMKKQQGSFAKFLPEGADKFRIFSRAVKMFTDAGYRYIGLDHFAKPDDELCRAQDDRTLHRNFQGYTTRRGCDLYALGVSAISSTEDAYVQSWRDLARYYDAINSDKLPTMRGMTVSNEDKLRRSVINRILCHTVVIKSDVEDEFGIDFDEHFGEELAKLSELERDNLVRVASDRIQVEPLGRVFIRNVAMVFDAYLNRPEGGRSQLFSKTL
jgi:oxygen-independent coproporphyrinogen-3 oxidase